MLAEIFNVKSPFFRPAWRRALVTAVCLLWAVFEVSRGATFWGILFFAGGAYLFYQFFVAFDPADYEKKD